MSQLAENVSDLLRAKKLKCASAESCTGGLVSASFTDLPGSSQVFERGFVTYSNVAKEEQLGVSPNILLHYGAVSPECADAMALGALQYSEADISVAVTGIAGPDGGSEEKPVGLVFIAVCLRGNEPVVTGNHFIGDRASIRQQSVQKAFEMLSDLLHAI